MRVPLRASSPRLDTYLLADQLSCNRYLNYCWMHVALTMESQIHRAVQTGTSTDQHGVGCPSRSSRKRIRRCEGRDPRFPRPRLPLHRLPQPPSAIPRAGRWRTCRDRDNRALDLGHVAYTRIPSRLLALRAAGRRATVALSRCLCWPDHRHGRLQVERRFSCFFGAEA